MNLLWLKEAKWLDCSSLSEAEFILISVQWSFLKLCLFVYLHGRGRWVQMLRSGDNLKEVLLFCYVWVLESQLGSSSLAAIVWGHLGGPSSVIFFFSRTFSFSGVLWYYLLKSTCAILCVHIQMAELTRTQISDAIGASGVSLTALYDHQRQHLPDFMKQLRTKAETDR